MNDKVTLKDYKELTNKRKGFIRDYGPIVTCKENQPFIDAFLAEALKSSPNTHAGYKSVLKEFTKYINMSFYDDMKRKQNIGMFDIRYYFDDVIDQKPVKRKTKNWHRIVLNKFFNFVQKHYFNKGIQFYNPIPSKDIYTFTPHEADILKTSEIEEKVLTIDQIRQILDYSYKNQNWRSFILIGLVVCTGARISEIRTIKIENINLEKRYFDSGFEPGARKTSTSFT